MKSLLIRAVNEGGFGLVLAMLKVLRFLRAGSHGLGLLVAAFALLPDHSAQAQLTLSSVSPADGATGVSPSTQVVFTFSGSVSFATATFSNVTANAVLFTTQSSSGGNTVLTCTAIGSFPNSSIIAWTLFAFDGATFLNTNGSFSTGSGGNTGGSGTNKITGFVVGKVYEFNQTSTNAPVVDASAPYLFGATTVLASNRTATNIAFTLPTGAVSNLSQNPFAHEDFFLAATGTNQSTFENTFPQGPYTFNVQAVSSNQTVTVTLPPAMQQPNAPHITDYLAAQGINPAQPFTLTWDAFTSGTATDAVAVVISDQATNVFQTANLGATNALVGTALSVTIPAGTLQPNSNYDGALTFYHAVFATNDPTYATTAYRATTTRFTLATARISSSLPVLTNAFSIAGTFNFDVLSYTNQTLTVVWATTPSPVQWQTLLTTNSPGRVHISDSRAVTNRALFYRARNGP